jgi:uncharacterized protein (DUF427 family)
VGAPPSVHPVVENVWDYPRPPALVPCDRRVRIELGGVVIADSSRALRVLETSHPPTIYVPRDDVAPDVLRAGAGGSLCEWKGRAVYEDVVVGSRVVERGAWHYPEPALPFAALTGHVSFYPGRMDAAWLGGERVRAQRGDFYGGWITRDLRGPFKGGAGTAGW